MAEIFVARQAIHNRKLRLAGYELLSRACHQNEFVGRDGDEATAQAVINAFVNIGLEEIAGTRPVFINVTPRFILRGSHRVLPPEKVILEIVESDTISNLSEFCHALDDSIAAGYQLALDDFDHNEQTRTLLTKMKIVKLDVRRLRHKSVRDEVDAIRRTKVQVAAKNVETPSDFALCHDVDVDLYQGYFFCRPRMASGDQASSNRIALLRLLSELQSPDVGLDDIEEVIRQDITLTHKLLRFINSPLCPIRREIDSVRQATVVVGVRRIKDWATLLLLASVDDRPQELVVTSLVRAKMCEILAQTMGERDPDRFFLVGLLSSLDAICDCSMTKAVSSLSLAKETVDALVLRKGIMGEVLDCVLHYEKGDWEGVKCRNVDTVLIVEAYLKAIGWTDDAQNTVVSTSA